LAFTDFFEFVVGEAAASSLPVISGESGAVRLTAESRGVLLDRESEAICVILPRFVYAPVKAGKVAGYVRIIRNGEISESITLYYAESVRSAKQAS
jgi:hypothetical protein